METGGRRIRVNAVPCSAEGRESRHVTVFFAGLGGPVRNDFWNFKIGPRLEVSEARRYSLQPMQVCRRANVEGASPGSIIASAPWGRDNKT